MPLDRFVPTRANDTELVLHRAPELSLATASATPAPASDWHRYVVAVGRHKWIVLAITLAGTLAGILATRLLDPRYAARATLWIEVAGRERDPAAEDGLVLTPSWSTLVTSQAVLEPVVRELRLFVRPDLPNDRAALATVELRGTPVPGHYRLVASANGQAELRCKGGRQGADRPRRPPGHAARGTHHHDARPARLQRDQRQ